MFSSMARGAGLQGLDYPAVNEFFAVQFLLRRILFGIVAPLPIQVRDLVQRAEFGGGIAMAIEAEGHAQRLVMIDFLHLVDGAMALDAANASIHVDRMVEIRIIRHAMDLNPFDRLARGGAVTD